MTSEADSLVQQLPVKHPKDCSLSETQLIDNTNDYSNELVGDELCLITCLRQPTFTCYKFKSFFCLETVERFKDSIAMIP